MSTHKPVNKGVTLTRHSMFKRAVKTPDRLMATQLVGKTIADPDIKERVQGLAEDLRKDKAALLSTYVEQGILTPEGKLTKRFGG